MTDRKKIQLYDTTLRDGAQGEGVSLTVDDKLKIAVVLDRIGVRYIEGGFPGSNPKDEAFFRRARSLRLRQARLVAFGSTRRRDRTARRDENLAALVRVKTPTVCVFGKSWDFQVVHALRASLEENLRMISDSVKFLRSRGREVIYDAEHFFDGYLARRDYALATLRAAWEAGAANLSLCDTNGGTLPFQVRDIVRAVRAALPRCPLGIHAHNDSDAAVANSLEAVREGCVLVQGTFNGLGERCGNANLVSIIPALKLKMGFDCVSDAQLLTLTESSRYVSEVANLVPDDHQPYVGHSAFAHKGGVHASAMARHTRTYEHLDPSLVGNKRRILVSELSGKANVHLKAKELKLDFEKDPKAVERVIAEVKNLENQGYQFEGAEGSFSLLVSKVLKSHRPYFDLKAFRVIVEKDRKTGRLVSEATLKVAVDGREEHTVGEGNGPVDALDRALRRALENFYPNLRQMSLRDFKVRVINATAGTAAKVRVLVVSRDQKDEWGTIGVSENIIEASWQALVDAVEYKLMKDGRG
ncbi:MAG TPA: citramalate synthase [Elusimicrobiota bacterium]|nr:citramalate synthase [Elusimicrobiota bacterium]